MGSSRWTNFPDLQIPDDQSFVDTNLRAVITTTDALDGSSTFFSDSLTVQNVDDPAIGELITYGATEAYEGSDFVVFFKNGIRNDPDGDLTQITLQWQKRDAGINQDNENTSQGEWQNINGENHPRFRIPESQEYVNQDIRLLAVTTDEQGGRTKLSSQSYTVKNVDDPASAQVLIHGNAEEGGSLTASLHNFSDPDGSLANTSFQWQQRIDDRWVPLDGQTSPDLQIPDDQSFVDTNLRAVITTTDALDGSSTFFSDSLTVQNVDDNPTGSVTINGDFLEKQTLTAANNLADQDGIGSISYSLDQR